MFRSVSDAIYSSAPGAEYTHIDGIGDVWAIPCDHEINLAFRIGGKIIPIHPLDISLDATDLGLSLSDKNTGKPFCLGSVSSIQYLRAQRPHAHFFPL
jgi:hypothetical protein